MEPALTPCRRAMVVFPASARADVLPQLSPAQLTKLRMLTVVSLSYYNKVGCTSTDRSLHPVQPNSRVMPGSRSIWPGWCSI